MDAGYKTAAVAKECYDHGTQAVFPYTRAKGSHIEGGYRKKAYQYDKEQDVHVCPEGEILPYRLTNREGYREYHSDAKVCSKCPSLRKCTLSQQNKRILTRHIWQDHIDQCDRYRLTTEGKKEYKKRKETIERQFANAKECHGFRYTNMKGLARMRMKAALTYACQNIKKLALLLDEREKCYS